MYTHIKKEKLKLLDVCIVVHLSLGVCIIMGHGKQSKYVGVMGESAE